jgi:molybdenum cofactor cytidylyltransferase
MTNTPGTGIHTTVILSAGKSERMGVPKFSLMYNNEMTFLEKIAGTFLEFGCNEVIVVLNSEGAEMLSRLKINLPREVKVAINYHPEWEKFFSLKTGLRSVSSLSSVFVSNIDNPFINCKLLEELEKSAGFFDYVYPAFNGKGGHPFIISERVVKDILSEPAEQVHLKEFLKKYFSLAVEVEDEKILANINTAESYRYWLNR